MNPQLHEDKTREHTFDGIQEFDKNLPNWWLFTLYGTIAFAIGYWIYFYKVDLGLTQEQELVLAMESVTAAKAQAAAESGIINDASLLAMTKNPDFVQAGKQVYTATCAACHGAELQGGIGLALNDGEWKHGGSPLQIKTIVTGGVAAAGMPPWGPVLGEEKVNQVVAYILTHHVK